MQITNMQTKGKTEINTVRVLNLTKTILFLFRWIICPVVLKLLKSIYFLLFSFTVYILARFEGGCFFIKKTLYDGIVCVVSRNINYFKFCNRYSNFSSKFLHYLKIYIRTLPPPIIIIIYLLDFFYYTLQTQNTLHVLTYR